mmetsp:Transcript_35178/g.98797  ORF Transcript_35178/g.98797 Transcript_35178/m.98797 type:complete len:267 (+) Transcript_35178:126-926(+)
MDPRHEGVGRGPVRGAPGAEARHPLVALPGAEAPHPRGPAGHVRGARAPLLPRRLLLGLEAAATVGAEHLLAPNPLLVLDGHKRGVDTRPGVRPRLRVLADEAVLLARLAGEVRHGLRAASTVGEALEGIGRVDLVLLRVRVEAAAPGRHGRGALLPQQRAPLPGPLARQAIAEGARDFEPGGVAPLLDLRLGIVAARGQRGVALQPALEAVVRVLPHPRALHVCLAAAEALVRAPPVVAQVRGDRLVEGRLLNLADLADRPDNRS